MRKCIKGLSTLPGTQYLKCLQILAAVVMKGDRECDLDRGRIAVDTFLRSS